MISLKDLAQEAVDNLKHKQGKKLPTISIAPDFSDYPVYVDRDKVMRVFSNLLINAVKYTGIDGQIEISAKVDAETVNVCIADTGTGIPEQELPRIFERFYRVEKTRSRDFGGTGLGLSIARKVVEGHGGNIWIESVPGIGTAVYFTLPGVDEGAVTTL